MVTFQMAQNRQHRCRGQAWQAVGMANGFRPHTAQHVTGLGRQSAHHPVVKIGRQTDRFITGQRIDICLLSAEIPGITAIRLNLPAQRSRNAIQFWPYRSQMVNGHALKA